MKKIIFLIIVYFLATPLQAKTASFVVAELKALEQQMHEKYAVEGLAQRMTSLHDTELWSVETDAGLKLYTVTQWLDRGFASDAIRLLQSIRAPDGFEDLYDYYQIVTFIQSNQSARSSLLLSQLEAKYPEDPDVLYLKSMFLADQNQVKEAIDVLNLVLQMNPGDGCAYLQRGVYHLVAMSPDNAIKDFESALRKLPKSEMHKRQQAYLQAGIIYVRFKMNGKKGEEYLKKGIALDPQSELVVQVKQALR